MKTKITTLVLCMMLSMFMTAQQRNDSFFNYQNQERLIDETPVPFQTSDSHGFNNMHVNAPLGNGLFIIAMISIVYVLSKRKEATE